MTCQVIAALYSFVASGMPRAYREAYGDETLADFSDLLEEAARLKGQSIVLTGVRAFWDLAWRMPQEHWNELRWNVGSTQVTTGVYHSTDHGWGLFMNWVRELRLAARALARRPGFTVVATLTLALGIGATTAIYAVVNAVLLEPLPYEASGDIVYINHHAAGLDLPELGISEGLLDFYWESADFYSALSSFGSTQRNLKQDGQTTQVDALIANPQIFDVLRVSPAMGRRFSSEDTDPGAAPVAILTDAAWKTRFGSDRGVLGRMIELDGIATEIIGVMPSGFAFPNPDPVLLTPLPRPSDPQFGAFGLTAVARLAPGVSLEQASQRLTALQSRIPERFPELSEEFFERAGWSASTTRLRDNMVADIESALWIVLGTVGLLLLIACANVANLFLVRSESRQKEMAVREAMGASGGSLAMSLLSESALLGALGGVVGIALAWMGLDALVASGPTELPRLHEISLGVKAVSVAGGLSLAAGLGFGLIPLLRRRDVMLSSVLREGGRGNSAGKQRNRARNILVASQLALALILLVGSGLMLRSFSGMRNIQTGYDADGVLMVGLSFGESEDRLGMARFYQDVADRVALLSGVEAVGITSSPPLSGSANGGSINIEGVPDDDDALPTVALLRAIGPGYFESMDISVIEGRDMLRSDWEDGIPFAWVNETFARTVFEGSALGQRINWGGDDAFAEIVGVVEDSKELELTEEPSNWGYVPLITGDWSEPSLEAAVLSVKMAEGQDGLALVPSIRQLITEANPNVPLTTARMMEEIVAASMATMSFTMVLLGIATAVAVFLGAIGLFGVISYVVSQRTREIGVRMALGARGAEVRGMVVRQAFKVTLFGTVLGLVGAFGLTRLMQSLLFETAATDPVTFMAAPALLIVISLLASWLPARRASKVDPMVALRSE